MHSELRGKREVAGKYKTETPGHNIDPGLSGPHMHSGTTGHVVLAVGALPGGKLLPTTFRTLRTSASTTEASESGTGGRASMVKRSARWEKEKGARQLVRSVPSRQQNHAATSMHNIKQFPDQRSSA